MKVRRALENPSQYQQNDYGNTNPIDANQFPEEIVPTRDQLKLPSDNQSDKFKQVINSYKVKLKQRRDFAEISQIWKSPAVPFLIVTNLFNLLVLLIGGIFRFEQIGPTIPLFYDPINQVRTSVDKIFLFIIPIFLLIFLVIQLRFIFFIFQNDKRLAVTISWLLSTLNILFLISISQLGNI